MNLWLPAKDGRPIHELWLPALSGWLALAYRLFPPFTQTSTHDFVGGPIEKFPVTMSRSPSRSMSPRSSVAWRGNPISIVCRANMPGAVCSSQTSAGSVCLVHVGAAGEQRRGDDVEVAVAVEVGGLGAVHAGHLRDRALDERIAAAVLEPLDPVIRLDDPVVERVAVGEEDVEVAVLVEIDELESRRSPVRMRRGIDRPCARRRSRRRPC